MISVLLPALGVLLAMALIMGIGWFVQRAARNGGWTDVFWTFGTGATLALAASIPLGAAPGLPWRRVFVAALVAIWSLRLGVYIARRVAGSPEEDARYAAFRRDWGADFQKRMVGLMLVQAPVSALLSLSPLLAARTPRAGIGLQDVLGLLVFAGALWGEAISDSQMHAFRANPANRGKVCDTGLWSWSRHPNYFFEAAVWVAYPVIALDLSRPWTLLSLIAPVIMFLTVRFASGVPPLEEAMLKSRGEAYRAYQKRVSAFIPRPPKTSAPL
jgi:steroid 5-alpha reductase family enzyme